jgi:hypothetical protein
MRKRKGRQRNGQNGTAKDDDIKREENRELWSK